MDGCLPSEVHAFSPSAAGSVGHTVVSARPRLWSWGQGPGGDRPSAPCKFCGCGTWCHEAVERLGVWAVYVSTHTVSCWA